MSEDTKPTGTENNPTPGSGQTPNNPPVEKTFTQAQLDAIIAERVSRLNEKYKDYDVLKQRAEDADAASKSESEKLTERATKAENRVKEIEREAKLEKLTNQATRAAIELGFDPKRIDKVLRLTEIKDDSTPESISKSLEALKGEMPELLMKKGAPATEPSNPSKPDPSAPETDDQKRARIFGANAFDAWTRQGSVVFNPSTHKQG